MIGNMTLESPTMLERTVKSYKQETKKPKQITNLSSIQMIIFILKGSGQE